MGAPTDTPGLGPEHPQDRPETWFEALVQHSTEGLAVLDEDRRFVVVNPMAEQILQIAAPDLIGRPAQMFETARVGDQSVRMTRIDLTTPSGVRILDVSESTFGGFTLLAFRDRTEESRRETHLTAFVQTAATVASASANGELLGEIASSVLEATGEASCTLVLYDDLRSDVREVGTAGGYPADYRDRLTACLRRGAPLASLGAFESKQPVVAPGWRDRVLKDPRWTPVHDILRDQEWGSLVAVPLTSQSRILGSITLFYRLGYEPGERDVEFLSAIGEMAAVAIVNHELAGRMARESALEERNRIARDLHDSVSQTVFSISLRSRALQLAFEGSGGQPAQLADQLADLHQLATGALADMKEMILHLRPETLESEGLIGLVRRHAAALTTPQALEVTVTSNVTSLDIPYADQLEILRIVQEAMSNAARHSGADELDVTFDADHERVVIRVVDNGTGFIMDKKPAGHFGLRTMSERAKGMGAILAIESRPGRTEVRVTHPTYGRSSRR